MKENLSAVLMVLFALAGFGASPSRALEISVPGEKTPVKKVESRFEEEPDDLTVRHRDCWLCHAKTETNEDAGLTENTFMKLMQSGKQAELSKTVGPLKVKLKKDFINHFTGKPYIRKNLICVTCHHKIHRKFGHPIGIATKKIQYIHMSPAYKDYTSQRRLKKINCDVCHDIHTDYYKYLVGIYDENKVETLCNPCHPEQAVPLPDNKSNLRNIDKDEDDPFASGDSD